MNNRDRNFTRAKMQRRLARIEESIARYLHQMDSADRQDPSPAIEGKIERLGEKIDKLKDEMQRLKDLEARMMAAPDKQVSLTDPDARSMATSGRGSENGVLLFSDETFEELRSRFYGSKFDRYVGREGRAVYLAQLEAVSEWVSITGAKLGCRDADDDKLLETALMGEADCLVTGDRDLLEMSPFNDTRILTPAGFLDLRAGG